LAWRNSTSFLSTLRVMPTASQAGSAAQPRAAGKAADLGVLGCRSIGVGAADSLTDVLRLLDTRTGSPAEVRPASPGVLRICAHVPRAVAGSGITALRVLLTADLLARSAELGGLQALTGLQFTDASPEEAAAIESDAGALGIHPPAVHAGCHDVPSSLGGPVDVHVAAQDAGVAPGLAGLSLTVGATRLAGAERYPGAAGEELFAASRDDPLAVRLALMSFPNHRPADVNGDGLAEAGGTLGSWRQQVARWAESPSRPIPAPIAEAARSAFGGLDTVSALALLRGLAPDASVPAGAKFETFVYADRILGLDLAREVGR
jgi:hypothetical protein